MNSAITNKPSLRRSANRQTLNVVEKDNLDRFLVFVCGRGRQRLLSEPAPSGIRLRLETV